MPWSGSFWWIVWALVLALVALMIWFPVYYWRLDRRRRRHSGKEQQR